MWADAIANAQVISTDATGALIQPEKAAADGLAQACCRGPGYVSKGGAAKVAMLGAAKMTIPEAAKLST